MVKSRNSLVSSNIKGCVVAKPGEQVCLRMEINSKSDTFSPFAVAKGGKIPDGLNIPLWEENFH